MCAQVGNQDHSLMLGVECADNVLFGSKVRLRLGELAVLIADLPEQPQVSGGGSLRECGWDTACSLRPAALLGGGTTCAAHSGRI